MNSMTERFLPPEELISQECDGRAIIATGALLTRLGQVAGCSDESKHDAVATPTTYFASFFIFVEPFCQQIAPEIVLVPLKGRPSNRISSFIHLDPSLVH